MLFRSLALAIGIGGFFAVRSAKRLEGRSASVESTKQTVKENRQAAEKALEGVAPPTADKSAKASLEDPEGDYKKMREAHKEAASKALEPAR